MKFAASFRAAMKWLAATIEIQELALVAGLALVAYGAAQIYPPAASLLPGAVLVYVAIAGVL